MATHFSPPHGATLSGPETEAVYGFGYSLLEAGRAEDAALVFGVLIRFAPFYPAAWQGLAAALDALAAAPAAALTLSVATLCRGESEPSPAARAYIEAAISKQPGNEVQP